RGAQRVKLLTSCGSISCVVTTSCCTHICTVFQAFESTLKSWEDKQKCEVPHHPSASTLSPTSLHPEVLSDEEAAQVSRFGHAAGALIHSIKEIAVSHQSLEQELAHAVNASSKSMENVYTKNSEVWSPLPMSPGPSP
ncbi:hypothetical protein FKM82_028764, partial [Ascaphus truei]